MKIRYTINDLQVLSNVLRVRQNNFDFLTFYEEILNKIRDEIREREVSQEFFEKCFKDWLLNNKFAETHNIMKFVFDTELKRVPLFINNERLKMFAEWRLKIAK